MHTTTRDLLFKSGGADPEQIRRCSERLIALAFSGDGTKPVMEAAMLLHDIADTLQTAFSEGQAGLVMHTMERLSAHTLAAGMLLSADPAIPQSILDELSSLAEATDMALLNALQSTAA